MRDYNLVRACPVCDNGNIHNRTTMEPTYRCGNGHEFDEPHWRKGRYMFASAGATLSEQSLEDEDCPLDPLDEMDSEAAAVKRLLDAADREPMTGTQY